MIHYTVLLKNPKFLNNIYIFK